MLLAGSTRFLIVSGILGLEIVGGFDDWWWVVEGDTLSEARATRK